WDMKPNAPVEIRGPYKPIKTNVPGIEISENFPRMAKHADKYTLIRSVYHTAAAVHDTGHQMMQTGRLFQGGVEYPHIGCVLSKFKVPDMLPPDYLSALRVDRRKNWREMVDHTVSKFETSQDARLFDATFHQA